MSYPAPRSSSSHPAKILDRGLACYNCRHRKIKCDGVQPVCGQCARANRLEDCEYINGGQRRAQVQILQENIDEVEKRIYALEHPSVPPPPAVRLLDPYQGQPSSGRGCNTSGQQNVIMRGRIANPGADISEPPKEIIKLLIDAFLPYAPDFGFFLNHQRFRAAALQPYPLGHPARPAPALLFSVYLCALRLAPIPNAIHQEQALLSQAKQLVSTSLSTLHPHKIMHTMQAQLLLSHFLFSCGRSSEGKYHTSAVISLGLGTSLHLVRAPEGGPLPTALDPIEEAERSDACWIAIIVDKLWAAALNEEPMMDLRRNSSDHRCVLEIPWRLEGRDYGEAGLMSQGERYSTTFHDFLNRFSTSDLRVSVLSMFTKAAILWQHVQGLSRDWNPNMLPQQRTSFEPAFHALNRQLERLRSELSSPPSPRLSNSTASPATARMRFVALSLAHAATIQLHSTIPPAASAPGAHHTRLSSARATLSLLASPPQPMQYVHPIMGTVWITAFQTLLSEARELKAERIAPAYPNEEEARVLAEIKRAIDVIVGFAGMCPLLGYQISRVRDAYLAL